MKYIITERQLSFITEQPDSLMDRRSAGGFQLMDTVIKPYCQKNPNICVTVGQLAVWFIPYVGPYLSAAIGAADSYRLFKEGKNTEGVISLMFSPLAIGKVLLISRAYNLTGPTIEVLKTINKSGLPVLISQGQQAFFNWLYNQFREVYKKQYPNDDQIIVKKAKDAVENFKSLLQDDNLQEEVTKTVKDKVSEWKGSNIEKYKTLKPKEKQVLDGFSKK